MCCLSGTIEIRIIQNQIFVEEELEIVIANVVIEHTAFERYITAIINQRKCKCLFMHTGFAHNSAICDPIKIKNIHTNSRDQKLQYELTQTKL